MKPFTHAKEMMLLGIEYGCCFSNWVDRWLDKLFERIDKAL
jgi:hypothetical protein